MIRVVFDANVIIGGAGWHGEAHACLVAMARRRARVFASDKPRSFVGAGKHLAKGRPLSAAPVPRNEWGDNY